VVTSQLVIAAAAAAGTLSFAGPRLCVVAAVHIHETGGTSSRGNSSRSRSRSSVVRAV